MKVHRMPVLCKTDVSAHMPAMDSRFVAFVQALNPAQEYASFEAILALWLHAKTGKGWVVFFNDKTKLVAVSGKQQVVCPVWASAWATYFRTRGWHEDNVSKKGRAHHISPEWLLFSVGCKLVKN